MNLDSQKEIARKAFYASIGAPVVVGRIAKEYVEKLVDRSNKMGDSAQKRFEELSKEGEKVTKQLRDADVVEEIQNRVDFDKVQDRVEKMRDQLEGALDSWRESFNPADAKKAPASKPAATKPASKAATKAPAKKAPAAKKTTTARKTTTAKTPATKAAASKTTTARKTTAAKTTAAKKTTATKSTAKKATAAKK